MQIRYTKIITAAITLEFGTKPAIISQSTRGSDETFSVIVIVNLMPDLTHSSYIKWHVIKI